MTIDYAMGRVFHLIDDDDEVCRSCDGTGVIDGKPCETCFGYGVIMSGDEAEIYDYRPVHPNNPCDF